MTLMQHDLYRFCWSKLAFRIDCFLHQFNFKLLIIIIIISALTTYSSDSLSLSPPASAILLCSQDALGAIVKRLRRCRLRLRHLQSPPQLLPSSQDAVPSNSNLSVTSGHQEKLILCFAATLTSKWHPGLRWLPAGSAAGRSWLKGKFVHFKYEAFFPPRYSSSRSFVDRPDGRKKALLALRSELPALLDLPLVGGDKWNLCFNCLTGDVFSHSGRRHGLGLKKKQKLEWR